MNILFISYLDGDMATGLSNSVPEQIRAQSKIDNVFWYNLNYIKRKEWLEDGLECNNLDDFPGGRLSYLPSPFNKPDIAIVEGIYLRKINEIIYNLKIIYDLQRLHIPYILIPRGELTVQAQRRHAMKKLIGNAIYWRRMIKNAAAIEYLTVEEKQNSEILSWNKKWFIIPNGIYLQICKRFFESHDGSLSICFIGRFSLLHKGLDLLLHSCILLRDKFIENNCTVKLYGADRDNTKNKLKQIIDENALQNIVYIEDAVFGEVKRDILLTTDAFVMTSRFEGLPMAMLEALSYGVPCFATKGTNMADVIAKYDAGWTAENTVEDITAQMSIMLDEIKNKNILKKKSENAKMLASNYDWDNLAKKAHKIYASVLS